MNEYRIRYAFELVSFYGVPVEQLSDRQVATFVMLYEGALRLGRMSLL